MERTTCFVAAIALLCAGACTRLEEAPLQEESRAQAKEISLTVRATLADAPKTRTVLNADRTIYWTKGDAINLFYSNLSSGKFTSHIGDEPVQTAEFSGTLTVVTGATEAEMSHKYIWGVYPYGENNTCDGTGVTMDIPSRQTAVAGSFADKVNPSVARSTGLDLAFYNVGAPFYFSVTQEGVTSVTFRGNAGEDIAGKMRVTLDEEGYPAASVVSGKKSITLYAPAGETLVPGVTYVMILLPQAQMANGYSVTFRKENLEATQVIEKLVQFKRSKGRDLMNADQGLTYSPIIPVPEAVDLGLSVKWASFNVGASTPAEYGDYYAWGETEPKSSYAYGTYTWCNEGSKQKLTKYCVLDNAGIWDGPDSPDGKSVLDPEDDVAHVKLGGSWRMPTIEECRELINQCTWTWTSNYNGTGIAGCVVSSKKAGYTGRSIFLPASGRWIDATLYKLGKNGFFWSSSLYDGSSDSAWCVSLNSTSVAESLADRSSGRSVRPVCD